MKNYKLRKKLYAIALAPSITTLTGCGEELAPEEEYDIVNNSESGLENGLTQTITVPGEDFKVIACYSCDSVSKREWRITSDKFLYINIHTQDLEEGMEVYIDNIHIDTSIKSKYAVMDGIMQDYMDDRVHNSLMVGFPIGNETYYYGINAIEGSNADFITGTFYGYSGYSSGTIEQKRYTESDYIDLGVYANKFSVVIDLLVKGPNDKEFRNISINSEFLVKTSNQDTLNNDTEEKVYTK